MRRRTLLAAILMLAALGFALPRPWPHAPLPPRQGPPLAAATTWGLQLQNVVALSIPDTVDMLVVDYSHDGTDQHALNPARIAALKARKGKPDRIVLCYMSIGEAESYRYYWHARWQSEPPPWLGKESAEWKGNFQVRYWHPSWQDIIVSRTPTVFTRLLELALPGQKPYIDRIVEAGCDGIYLDRIDAFSEWQAERGPQAEADMARFVELIAAHAHERRPGFLVVAQNGEELLQNARYRAALDGVAKEDFLYGVGGEEAPNTADVIEPTKRLLDAMKAEGKPVFVVEYLQSPGKRLAAQAALGASGYIPLFARRTLHEPPEPAPPAGTNAAGAAMPPPSAAPGTPR